MRHDKEYIFSLRKQGKSYRQIQQETGVSRATLSAWFKDIQWSKHTTSTNRKGSLVDSKNRIIRMNQARSITLNVYYNKIESESIHEYEVYRDKPLFWAGLMAYAGEGDKRTASLVRITNTEFYIHRIFIAFAEKYLGVAKGAFKVALLLYPEHSNAVCTEVWSKALGVEKENFHKTQVLQGKEKVKRLQYGIAMSILSSTALKKKILIWLSLAQSEKFDAVIV